MEKIYISLGSDCGTVSAMIEANKKAYSFPLDWLIGYYNIHKIFENDFKGFLGDRVMNTELVNEPNEFNLEYNIRFFHQELIKDYETTIQRRVDRLLLLLMDSNKEINFIRRSHGFHHHKEIEHCGLSVPDEIDDVKDMMFLVDILVKKYPKLKFKIHLFLQCLRCNNLQENFTNKYINIVKYCGHDNPKQREEEFLVWVTTL